MEEQETIEFNSSPLKALIGKKRFFIDKNGDVDSGKIKKVTVDEGGGIEKLVIKGSKTVTVFMCQVFDFLEDALKASIMNTDVQIATLTENVAALQGRLTHCQEENLLEIEKGSSRFIQMVESKKQDEVNGQ